TDFDGIDDKGLEIDNIGDMDKLLVALNNEGFSDDIIEKIFYKNALRVIKEVMK
ncbi:MAG TPA: peptidase M19, partial [Clostridium sp.]|nr:peptidase M19 [Clostridium sp.]